MKNSTNISNQENTTRFLFEEDPLSEPVECFIFDAAKESFPVKPHWHYYMELIYGMEGSAELYSSNQHYLLEEGDLLLLHPKTVHSIYAAGNAMPKYAVLKFDINRLTLTPNYAPKLRSIFKSAEKRNMKTFWKQGDTDYFDGKHTFLSCVKEMIFKKYGYDLIINTELYHLLISIIRTWKEYGFQVDNEAFAEDDQYDIYNITEYIEANMDKNIPVTKIATRCNMSYSYFSKRFNSVYGQTCKEYIESMRIYKVEEFLIFTDFDLSYISQETGFSDCSHMIKCFKKFRNVTPKQFRIRHMQAKK